MVINTHLKNSKRNKIAPRMKALMSALLIVLSGVTAVVAQQTSLTNMEDSPLNSSQNQGGDEVYQEERDEPYRDEDGTLIWPTITITNPSNNTTKPTKNVRDTLRPIIVLVIVESQEPISLPTSPPVDKMCKPACISDFVSTNVSTSTIAESVCKGKYVPDGRNDGKVSNDDQKEMVCNFKDGKSGSDLVTEINGKFLDLRNDPIFRAKFASLMDEPVHIALLVYTWKVEEGEALMDEPVHDAPKLYMPHYTNWYASVGIASQHATYGLNLAEYGMAGHVSHSNDTGNDENIDFPDIPPSLGGGNPTATILILILNWDHDGDGYSLLDDILNWVCDIFKGDEDGDDEDDGEGENDDSGSGGADCFKDPGNGNPPWGPWY